MAFLLLTLLIAGIIVGAVLLRRANKRGKRIEKRRKSVELIECVDKREEIVEVSLAGTSSTGNDSERQINDNLVHHCERIQTNDEPGYESVDVVQQRRISRLNRKGSRSKGDNYIAVEAAKNVPSKEEVKGGVREMGQQRERPRGNPSAVYAVVDKSKKKKQEKTQGGASATTTQGADTEEQHYECSSGFGQDWLGNVLEVSHGDGGQGGLSNDSWETYPQSEPCTASAVYAVVDKSKKHKGEKTQGGASATTTQGADTEEQHYEWSSGFGQDWLGNALRVRGDVGRRSPSNDAKQAGPQSEPHNSGAVYAVVDKNKKGNKGKKNSDLV